MAHKVEMVMDFQYGSTGKGLIAGYLAKREDYDTAICAFATNAGHTYIDESRGIHVMTQQLPTSITSPTVKTILIGPGAAIHLRTLREEIDRYYTHLKDKRLIIHPHAAVVEDYHAKYELNDNRTKMGSTAKGVGEAYVERIRRDPKHPNIMQCRVSTGDPLYGMIGTPDQYRDALMAAESVIVEGAQGFSLSLYHGAYPYVTSRDVTPWQIAADCGLPYRWASYVRVIGAVRTFPIRVSNRDGSSGPCYPDQREMKWEEIGMEPELTTVTKLPRRLFTFSQQQLQEAMYHCGGYWDTRVFLNFANYIKDRADLLKIIDQIQHPTMMNANHARIAWFGFGPDDKDVLGADK